MRVPRPVGVHQRSGQSEDGRESGKRRQEHHGALNIEHAFDELEEGHFQYP